MKRAHSGKVMENQQNRSTQLINRRVAYSVSQIPDYLKNFVIKVKIFYVIGHVRHMGRRKFQNGD